MRYLWLNSGGPLELASSTARLGARAIDLAVFGLGWIVLFMWLFFTFFGDALEPLTTLDPEADAAEIELILDDEGLADRFERQLPAALLSMSIALVVAGFVYEVAFIALKGQTPGKMAARIKVVTTADGSVPGWGRSLGRWAIPAAPVIIPLAGLIWAGLVYLSITWDPRGHGWHDKAAGTTVVRHERERRPMV